MNITDDSKARLSNYESRTNPYLVSLALAFLVIYAVPILWTGRPPLVAHTLDVINVLIWLAFVADLVIRAKLSGRPGHYLVRHPIDVILIAVPMLRVLRVLRVFTAANYLITRGGLFAVGRTIASAAAATIMLMVVGALAMLDTERGHAGATINTFGDALWWAASTVTTVGYGDEVPVTATGRIVAFAMMVVGISVLGVITASVAAWFVEKTHKEEDEILAEIRQQGQEIAQLRELLLMLRTPDARSS